MREAAGDPALGVGAEAGALRRVGEEALHGTREAGFVLALDEQAGLAVERIPPCRPRA